MLIYAVSYQVVFGRTCPKRAQGFKKKGARRRPLLVVTARYHLPLKLRDPPPHFAICIRCSASCRANSLDLIQRQFQCVIRWRVAPWHGLAHQLVDQLLGRLDSLKPILRRTGDFGAGASDTRAFGRTSSAAVSKGARVTTPPLLRLLVTPIASYWSVSNATDHGLDDGGQSVIKWS